MKYLIIFAALSIAASIDLVSPSENKKENIVVPTQIEYIDFEVERQKKIKQNNQIPIEYIDFKEPTSLSWSGLHFSFFEFGE